MNKNPVALVILDGLGEAPAGAGNAVKIAKTPVIDEWTNIFPHTFINASSHFVGLPEGQMGNSEVGHLNIGAGRIVHQSLTLINKNISNNNLGDNKILLKAIKHAKKNKSKVNLIGLISDGGVHSDINHIIALANEIKKHDVEVVLQAFTDGRDVSQKSALKYLDILTDAKITIASISGRFYAMDRDKRWERVQKAYDAIVLRKGETFSDYKEYVKKQYANNVTDEFFVPAYNDDFDKTIKPNDTIVSFNFRPDRARELAHMLIGSNQKVTEYNYGLDRLKNLYYISTREYAGIVAPVMWPADKLKNLLGEVLERNHLNQVRAAETEKYPHVTFFLDGGEEIVKKHETRILVDSPKVLTYDLEPEMSCEKLTEKIIEQANDKDVFLINFAQADMVGHTGIIPAVVKAVEIADKMLQKLYDKIVTELGGVLIIVADHGNAEQMLEKDGKTPMTMHSTNKVKLIITDKEVKFTDDALKMDDKGNPVNGKLADLAPIILQLLNIKQPKEMTGVSLIE